MGEEEKTVKPDEFEAFHQQVVNVSRHLRVSLDVALMLIMAFELRCIHDHFNMMLKGGKE